MPDYFCLTCEAPVYVDEKGNETVTHKEGCTYSKIPGVFTKFSQSVCLNCKHINIETIKDGKLIKLSCANKDCPHSK